MRIALPLNSRACRFERMEARMMLSASGAEPPQLEEPVLSLPGSISGAVYASLHPDSERQLHDAGIPGVLLDLLDDQGRVLAQTTTDDAGVYEFSPLAPGRYAIREHQPAGTLDGQAWIGDGGGEVAAIDVIGEIWVDAGANLAGYDFAELADAAGLGNLSVIASGSTLPFMAIGAAPAIDRQTSPPAAEKAFDFDRPIFTPAAERLAALTVAPVFGGSSRELGGELTPSEVKRSVAEPAGDWLAKDDDRDEEQPVRISRLPAEDSANDERAAHDRAFEQDGADATDKPIAPDNNLPAKQLRMDRR